MRTRLRRVRKIIRAMIGTLEEKRKSDSKSLLGKQGIRHQVMGLSCKVFRSLDVASLRS